MVQYMIDRGLNSLEICGVRNKRLSHDLAGVRYLDSADASDTVGKIRDTLNKEEVEGVDPETFWKVGEGSGFDVQVRWSIEQTDGRYDVEFIDRRYAQRDPVQHQGEHSKSLPRVWKSDHARLYANDPWGRTVQDKLASELQDYLKGKLPPYMVPKDVVVLPEFPLTPNGKLDLRALPTGVHHTPPVGEYEAPHGAVEQLLAEIWQEILSVDRVSRHDNFFELGGHSRTALKLLHRITQRFSTQLRIQAVFRNPTLRRMAAVIEATFGF